MKFYCFCAVNEVNIWGISYETLENFYCKGMMEYLQKNAQFRMSQNPQNLPVSKINLEWYLKHDRNFSLLSLRIYDENQVSTKFFKDCRLLIKKDFVGLFYCYTALKCVLHYNADCYRNIKSQNTKL